MNPSETTDRLRPWLGALLGVTLAASVVVGGGSVEAATSKAGVRTSAYVDLSEATCVKVDGPKTEDDFQDWGDFRCGKRVAGWQAYVEYGDLREELALERNGVKTGLGLTRLHGTFSVLGPRLEFRLRNGVAYAVVVRHIFEDPMSDTGANISALVVARLSPRPCSVADIPPGPNQSALARQAADAAPTLKCLLPPA